MPSSSSRAAETGPLPILVTDSSVRLGNLVISVHRTLRIPDDGGRYPLPPSLGRFPICRIEDYRDRVPAAWLEEGGIFIPMYQREAAWLSFDNDRDWQPMALKVGVGGVNAVSGEPWDDGIEADRDQDYLVIPDQPWLDGIKSGDGVVRQFVAMPMGTGYSVEAQVTGQERIGGMQLRAYAAKPGRFPDNPEDVQDGWGDGVVLHESSVMLSPASDMGIAAGGQMEQDIYPDEYGAETWDTTRTAEIRVRIVNSQNYRDITGRAAPESPISARTYTEHGLPWFDLYDEHLGDVGGSDILGAVEGVKEIDKKKGFTPQQDDGTVVIDADQVITKPVPEKWPKFS